MKNVLRHSITRTNKMQYFFRDVRLELCIHFIIVSALAITTIIYYNHATINDVERAK